MWRSSILPWRGRVLKFMIRHMDQILCLTNPFFFMNPWGCLASPSNSTLKTKCCCFLVIRVDISLGLCRLFCGLFSCGYLHVEFIPACLRCPLMWSLNRPCHIERSLIYAPFLLLFVAFSTAWYLFYLPLLT